MHAQQQQQQIKYLLKLHLSKYLLILDSFEKLNRKNRRICLNSHSRITNIQHAFVYFLFYVKFLLNDKFATMRLIKMYLDEFMDESEGHGDENGVQK